MTAEPKIYFLFFPTVPNKIIATEGKLEVKINSREWNHASQVLNYLNTVLSSSGKATNKVYTTDRVDFTLVENSKNYYINRKQIKNCFLRQKYNRYSRGFFTAL